MQYPLIAHISSPEPQQLQSAWALFKNAWHWDPLAIVGVAIALLIYLFLFKFSWDRHLCFFVLGNLVILIALISPIATIGETYLFSVHMIQHLLLEIVAVPLLILGISPKIAGSLMKFKTLRHLAQILGNPYLAWLIGVGTLWIWHWPLLYNLTLENQTIHILEHATFIISATIFWYALLDPIEKYRLAPLAAILYLFTAGLVNTLLAILLTFAPAGLYPYYLHPKDLLGALSLIREQWGISAQLDQEMGGAVMWVLGGIVFTIFLIILLARWYAKPHEEEI